MSETIQAVEAEAGDVVFFDTGEARQKKVERERMAIDKLRTMLPAPTGEEVHALWHEFEEGQTGEARFARALDNLEVQIQHNFASIETWEAIEYGLTYTKTGRYAEHDGFLRSFAEAVIAAGERKMRAAGVDVVSVRERAL